MCNSATINATLIRDFRDSSLKKISKYFFIFLVFLSRTAFREWKNWTFDESKKNMDFEYQRLMNLELTREHLFQPDKGNFLNLVELSREFNASLINGLRLIQAIIYEMN